MSFETDSKMQPVKKNTRMIVLTEKFFAFMHQSGHMAARWTAVHVDGVEDVYERFFGKFGRRLATATLSIVTILSASSSGATEAQDILTVEILQGATFAGFYEAAGADTAFDILESAKVGYGEPAIDTAVGSAIAGALKVGGFATFTQDDAKAAFSSSSRSPE